MNKVLRLFHILYLLLVFVPVVLAATLVTFCLILVTCLFSKLLAFSLWVRGWSRLVCWLTPLRVKRIGADNIESGQSYIVVANHASQYDIALAAGWIPLDLKWVAKQELKNTLIVGTVGKAMGNIFIDRRNRQAAIQSLDEAKRRLVNGVSLVFFPEGTRSKTSEMLPFKKGAFVMAKEMNLPILPISLCNTRNALPSGSILPRAGQVQLVVHSPITAAEVEQLSHEQLRDKAQTMISSVL